MAHSNKIPKAAIRRIEVATRACMREKVKDSAFLRKSLNIFNGQSARAAEISVELPYTIEEFRGWMKPLVGTLCNCGKKLTVKQIAIDHNTPVSRGGSWTLENLRAKCRSCNWRKGIILPHEYQILEQLLATFTDESRADIFRRLTLGGKWSFRSDSKR